LTESVRARYHGVMRRRLAELAVAGLVACSGCSLLLDTDALTREGDDSASAGRDGTSGTGSTEPSCDATCDGRDRDCQPTLDEPSCPAGCDGVVVEGHSFLACAEGASFIDAQTSCLAQGMDLVRIDSSGDNAIVVELARTVGSYVWIGGSDLGELGRYAWRDGDVFFRDGAAADGAYQNFGSGEPMMGVGRECVQLHDEPAGPWSTAPCSDVKPFVCGRAP
jgi:hypothetical protein